MLLAAALFTLGSSAAAEVSAEDKQQARAAYERGAEASARGDHATAAKELARADELAPNTVTLEAAIQAALDAEDAVLGMELVARAEARGEGGKIAELAQQARSSFAARVGRVKILCSGPPACTATLDGAPIRLSQEKFVLTGNHVAAIQFANTKEQRTIEVKPGALTLVDGWPSLAREEEPYVKSPAWFILMTGMAAVVAGGTIASGVDTRDKHAAFVGARCQEPGPPPECAKLAEDGRDAQARTNLFVGVTAGAVLTAGLLGLATFVKPTRSAPTSGFSIEPGKDRLFAKLVLVLP